MSIIYLGVVAFIEVRSNTENRFEGINQNKWKRLEQR